jgi:SAM-dependent methyltransferase
VRGSARDFYWNSRRRAGELFVKPRNFEDTAQAVTLEEVGLDHPDWNYYAPSGWLWIKRALRGLGVGPGDVFVDFGSGKGRVVYQAARSFRFKRVVGVEVAEAFNAVARTNIEANRHRLKCRDVELVTIDAAQYPIPPDMTVAYFYNPFGGDVFRAVLRNIVDSLDRAPRRMYVIYANPLMADELLATGRFVLHAKTRGGHRVGRRGRGELSIFVTKPAP